MKRIAVIGFGGQGAWHCEQILKSDVAELAGTYDIREVRRNAAKQNGIFVYDSNQAIFEDKSVDIIVVATPNDVHEELVVNALKSGHNVICEKPVALSVEEFDRMINQNGQVAFEKATLRQYDLAERIKNNLPQSLEITGDKGITLQDVASGKNTLDQFVAQFDAKALAEKRGVQFSATGSEVCQ